MSFQNNPESVLKSPENRAEFTDLSNENMDLERQIVGCDNLRQGTNYAISERYPKINIPKRVSNDGQDELARQMRKSMEENQESQKPLEEAGKNFINRFVDVGDRLTKPTEEIIPDSDKLNVAAQEPQTSFFEKDGVLAGNSESPAESVNAIA